MPGSSSFSFDPLSSYFRTSQPLTDPLAPRRLPQGDVCCASKVSPRTLAAEVDCTICGAG